MIKQDYLIRMIQEIISLIVNALLIARYGCAVLDIHERGCKA
jgi:hypothetical protein